MTEDDRVDVEEMVEDTAEDTEAQETAADETDTDASDTDESVEPVPVPQATRTAPSPARLILPIALVVILVLSAGAAVFTYVALYRGDQKVDQAVAAQVIQSASDGAVALLSYTPDTLDQDFSKAKSRLTGDFLNYYTRFTQEIVTPAAKQKSVKTSAAVVRSALSKLEPTSAEVLLFVNQSTVSKENPDGSFTASSVKVEMTKVGSDWLISSFDPV